MTTATKEAPPRYTARSIKATGLIEEARSLLRAWQPDETTAALRRRVREESLLGRATASRSDDVVAHVFNQRFLAGPDPPAPRLKQLLEQRGSGRWFTDLCFLYAARTDIVLRDAVTVYAAGRRSSGRLHVDPLSLVAFLGDQEAEGRMARPWSPGVKLCVAQHILRQMTDFGVAGPSRRGVRELLPFEPTGLGFAWLAYDLHLRGISDPRVVAHPDWQVWGLDEARTRERFSWLARPELWEFQAAGAVVKVTWSCGTWEEAVDVFARSEFR